MRRDEGRLDPPEIPADDRGFLLGDGLFETVRVYRGVPFRLGAHLERLAAGAAWLGIPLPSELEWRVRRFLRDGPPEAALRVTVSRGRASGLAGDDADEPRVALRLLPVEGSDAPLTAALEGRVHEDALSAGVKGLGYLERILALRRARERGADEALIRNTRGELVEGSVSNLVAVDSDGSLVAPGQKEGALPGITRRVVLDEAGRLGMAIHHRGLRPGEVRGVRELFLTSSIRELAPVIQVEGHRVGSGAPGPVYLQLRDAFRRVVEREVAAESRGGTGPPEGRRAGEKRDTL